MNFRQRLWFSLALVVASANPAYAQLSGEALMREGNGLFRSGLYRAALVRYQEASARGLDTALLNYNLGVVYYKLEQPEEAIPWLTLAAADPSLAVLASINLGLALRAAGRPAEADPWFARAVAQADSPSLRRLAEQAAGRSAAGTGPPDAAPRRAYRPERDARIGDFRLVTLVRLAQDSNVYWSPADPYIDLSAAAQPLVTPVVQSASFAPVDLLAEYVLTNEAQDTDFNFSYRLDGDFYDSAFTNANRISQRFEIGADIVLSEAERRMRRLQSAFFVRSHDEVNFDPDTGADRDIGGVDISQRFSFSGAGLEADYDHLIGRWRWGLEARFERRHYEDVPPVASYSHSFYFGRASIEYALNDATALSFGLRRYRRVYDERLARDLNGDLLIGNPFLEYNYQGYQIGVNRKLGNKFEIDVDLLSLERVDGFLGYYDYTQNVVRVRAAYRPSSRVLVSLAASSRTYDYPNAFAFSDPVGGPLELDSTDGEFLVEYRISSRLAISAEVEMTDLSSTDPRSEYGRSVAMLGVRWRR